jgi:hypothetical protein
VITGYEVEEINTQKCRISGGDTKPTQLIT